SARRSRAARSGRTSISTSCSTPCTAGCSTGRWSASRSISRSPTRSPPSSCRAPRRAQAPPPAPDTKRRPFGGTGAGEERGSADSADLAGVGGEMLEEQPFRPRQLDELAPATDHPPLEVDLDVVEGDDTCARLDAGRATDHRPHAGGQLIGMEGFGDVVVGAEVEPLRLVGGGSLGSEEDDRY